MELNKNFDDRYVAYSRDRKYAVIKATIGAIIERAGKILLTKRNIEPFKGRWCLPGGHIEFFERAKDAVTREVKEETGLDFKGEFTGYIDEIIPELNWHAAFLVFKGFADGREKISEQEVLELQWFTKEEALKQPLAFRHAEAIEKYF